MSVWVKNTLPSRSFVKWLLLSFRNNSPCKLLAITREEVRGSIQIYSQGDACAGEKTQAVDFIEFSTHKRWSSQMAVGMKLLYAYYKKHAV